AKDPFKCNGALSGGQWLDSPQSERSQKPFQRWQPDGCMTRTYPGKRAIDCLRDGTSNENAFIGDSTVREIFWATARLLNTKTAMQEASKAEKHEDRTFTEGSTTINFFWDPFLNSSTLTQYLGQSRAASQSTELNADKGLLVLGAGLWFAKDEDRSVDRFKDAMDSITSHLALPDLESMGTHRPLIVPVQPPYYENMPSTHKSTITSSKIDAMNAYLEELATMHDVDVLNAFLDMVKDMPASAYEPKGLHVLPQVADRQAELILNLKCNNEHQTYTYSGTCCYDYQAHWIAYGILGAGAALFALYAWVELQVWAGAGGSDALAPVQKRLPLLRAMLVVWAALCYCYMADRTHLFDKVLKLYNAQDFYVFVTGFILVGAFSVQRSSVPQKPGQEKAANTDQPFLSRDQTDEWKGWMQLAILAYHYTGGSKVLWIYKIIRLLVASYLFMTGYGHAAYFYQKKDFSLKRVAAVNIRLNLLSCLLPWTMNTDYLFYYFAPLVTYWYAVVYLTMFVKKDWNQNMTLFLVKIAVAAASTTLLHQQHWLFEPIIQGINAVFGSKWDAKEWLFRASLDQFIGYIGMIVAVIYIRVSKPPSPPPPPQSSMSTTSHTQPGSSPHLRNGLYFAASFASLAAYTYASSMGNTKASSNALHPYVSPLPIMAFIHLRNCTRSMRNNYSTAYAWIGKISLETFVLQYHIWLAADTTGLLSLGIFGRGGMGMPMGFLGAGMGLARWADCILLGVVFIWLSSKVATATGLITSTVMKALFV
ncbi:MAG: hypothetical protein M1828_002382, partial [Chrysothrix sp. TS-e1954]